jgi:3'-5' exoribonuclease
MTPNYKNVLESQAHSLGFQVYEISQAIFEDIPEFEYWSGSGKPEHHHYGDYGLAQHTKEVIDLMFAANETLRLHIGYDILFLAGLFHDIGKVWDYAKIQKLRGTEVGFFTYEWEKTPHARNIHHISRSALIWSKAVDNTGLFIEEHDEILHAILAHHGQREWGSPVAPNSKLAWLLHLCDGISARMDDCEKHDLIKH